MKFFFKTTKYSREEEERIGTLTTLSNGRLGLRGEHELYPSRNGLIYSGVYDYTPIFRREIVSLPRPLYISLRINDKNINIEATEKPIERILDIDKGVLESRIKLDNGIKYQSIRLVHRLIKPLIVYRIILSSPKKPIDVYMDMMIDTNTCNTLVPENIFVKHYEKVLQDIQSGLIIFRTLDEKSLIGYLQMVKTNCGEPVKGMFADETILTRLKCRRKNVVVDYFIAVVRDKTEKRLLQRLLRLGKKLNNLSYEEIYFKHTRSWKRIWRRIGLRLKSRQKSDERYLRFITFHLLQLIDEKAKYVMLPAKGLHGFGYRGHVFWDTEIYTLPFYALFFPKFAKKILLFRYKTLSAAKRNAKRNGYEGAQYPWESDDEGEESTPKIVPLDHGWNKNVRIWTGDEEIHITADIAYAVNYYYIFTGDEEFMEKYGLEIIFETARYWASRLEYDRVRDRYVLENVMGPDEYHPHVNNSYYVNIMAKHNLELAAEYYTIALEKPNWKRIIKKLSISNEEARCWRTIAEKIFLPCHTNGICEEFEGYSKLPVPKLNTCKQPLKVHDLYIDSRIEDTGLIKQADVILAQFLLRKKINNETIKKNYLFYIKRTTHESSLSMPSYAGVAAYIGMTEEALDLFRKSLRIDIEDLYENVKDGIHLAAAGGIWFSLIHGFLGLDIKNGKPTLDPRLPRDWEELSITPQIHGKKYKLYIINPCRKYSIDGG